jgi:hypothetical protein
MPEGERSCPVAAPSNHHDKEGVDGSSPSEGSGESPVVEGFLGRGQSGIVRPAAHNRILEEPAMAKARSVVGLDVHATKTVAAVGAAGGHVHRQRPRPVRRAGRTSGRLRLGLLRMPHRG